jgi:hypothetical protein
MPSLRSVSATRFRTVVPALAILMLTGSSASAQWVRFANETSTRLVSASDLGASDLEEKDYAWGDFDKDGDIDLAVVRKTPFTSPGKRRNVLFMNENGVLRDRTNNYATSSDIPGDQGFLTETNDRDVVAVDVDNDTWLDLVTATTISDGDPKHIGHPRVYRNRGVDAQQQWLGFRFEDFRIPPMRSYSGLAGFNPRFCAVAAGDVDGDGLADLYFGDYDSSGVGGGNPQPAGADYNDRLLINFGDGVFKDLTAPSFDGLVPVPDTADQPFEISAFGAADAIADMNGDGWKDIVKQTSLNDPLYVGIAYNTPSNPGFFNTYDVVNDFSPYFVSVGDLNNDDRLDLVITDDGDDRYMLNQGNGGDQIAEFSNSLFSFDAASDDGFGSNSVIADLNNDGWNDVLIADVDVDIEGCSRRMHIYRNLGGAVGGNVTLQEQTQGTGCATSQGNPASCLVASIPSNMLEGVHDVAVFDINGDDWLDMVIGRCTGTQVWMSQPPVGLAFSYPQGLPLFVEPGQPHQFQVQITGVGGGIHQPGTAQMFVAIESGPFSPVSLSHQGGGLYTAQLPPAAACTDRLDFYFTAQATNGATFHDPAIAPAEYFTALAALGTETAFEDGMEGSVAGWSVVNHASLTSGAWQRADPVGTISGNQQAAPDDDADGNGSTSFAFVTQNGAPGGAAGASDVDGGPTDLISPPIDLAGTDARITYSRWFFSSGDDTMTVWVSNNGTNWVLVETVPPLSNTWQVSSFVVGNVVTPSSTVQVRFRVNDTGAGSIVEGGVDLFKVEAFICDECQTPGDCSDGVFCNGAEQCDDGECVPGDDPCPGQVCDESGDQCVECVSSATCDDGVFCNGLETCTGNVCQPGSDPCPGQLCDEGADFCADCLVAGDCDDGLFCNGAEACVSGSCSAGAEACPGQVCDEDEDECQGEIQLQPKMGQPLLGLTAAELDRFLLGREAFDGQLNVAEGLGPIFNQNSCGACHNTPLGGSGTIKVTRFGFNDDKGGGFDSLEHLGGSLRQAEAIMPQCAEIVPPEANVVAERVTNSTLGFGLVEAIADADITANATSPPAGVSGVVHMVDELANPGTLRVGRFGWKSQVATLLDFSADASLNEMGLTNRILGTENDPNGVNAPSLGAPDDCDTVPDPEDGPDAFGFDFIDRVTDFQRFLAPPPQTPRSGMTGEALFTSIGCANCHVATFHTKDEPSLEDAIRDKPLHPYSDFLLHDMGLSADFIEQGGASGREIRTAPLWGLRVRDPLWHDGRVAGGTFVTRVTDAIALHDALNSEGRVAAQAYAALLPADKNAVIAFLDSLGRAEFDMNGDGNVNHIDFATMNACVGGGPYTPDDNCAIADVDQDGDVDSADTALFTAAAEGAAGALTGNSLLIERTGGQITLSWNPSCSANDVDFAVYEGTIGDFASHQSVLCTTSGATSAVLTPSAGATYYLVVPTNGFREGSYGVDSQGAPRPAGANACLPQTSGACGP